MNSERQQERLRVVRTLRFHGCFIACMGVIGVLAYSFDIAGTREHPIIVLIGTAFCTLASVRMFCLAEDVKNRRD